MNPQDQTTEPKTLDIASLSEKGVFVTVDDHEDLLFDAAIREAGQRLKLLEFLTELHASGLRASSPPMLLSLGVTE